MQAWDKLITWHRAFAKEYTYPTTSIGLLVGAVITFYGLLAYAFPDHALTPKVLVDWLGAWSIWLFLFGLLLVMVSGWFLYQVMGRMNRFMELIDTTSKKKFKENLDKLESLAYYHLPERFSKKLLKHKERFGIK